MIGRTHGGGAILVTGHIHGDSVTVLRESEPGVFVMGDEPSAFPVAITISVPEPGKLIHSWSYGAPGEEPVERDRVELTRSGLTARQRVQERRSRTSGKRHVPRVQVRKRSG